MSDASDAATHPRYLELPRNENGLATSKSAVRRLRQLLPTFLEDRIAETDADRFVVTLDGGAESSVAAAMAADAVGPERVVGLIMPVQLNDEAPARDAEAVATMLGIEQHRLQLQPLHIAFQRVIGTTGEPADDFVAMENAGERFRMACAYYAANTRNGLVVGSVNRTDRLLGSVAKFGENGVDLSLLGDLYRTEVLALARDLEMPEAILEGSRRQAMQTGTSDAAELGVEPATLDSVLHFSIDRGHDVPTVARQADVETELVRRVKKWCSSTRHKRHQPPKPSMGK